MKYSDIVTLRQMRPAYNIKDERQGEWKTFIANDQFNDLLLKTIRAVRNNDVDYHKSIWIAGTYGSGKSHAGAVLQHLFCDPVEEISEYVDEEYGKPKYDVLRNGLYQVRDKKRLFPVNLYGQQNISHEEDLSLQLQREIKRALRKAGIKITVKTDFDMYVQHIDNQPHFWESLIEQNPQLASVAPDTNKLKQRLDAGDTDVLESVREALRNGGYDIRMQSNNLQQWILEVQDSLRETTDYSGLLIIWDEFTEIMTCSIALRLIVQLQEIVEVLTNSANDSYFLFISHPSAFNVLGKAQSDKTIGRFNYVTYNMEVVSAFKIMSKKFKVVDSDLYAQRQKRFFGLHTDLLNTLISSSNDSSETAMDIMNLYPLHPGTANLATYYAREAGSSSRSVFEFLASDAVRDFLNDEAAYDEERTITADYLWDYVRENFERDPAQFGAVTERYNSHHLQVESQGDNYVRVFKGILLLNALNNIANNDTVTPSEENIDNLFIGTQVEFELPQILDFFNEKSIIQRQPNGNYSILFTALPTDEIQRMKEELKSTTFVYTNQVIKFGKTAYTLFSKNLTQVARPYHLEFFSTLSNEYTLVNQISNLKKQVQPYETFLAIMVGRNNDEINTLNDIAERNCKDERFHDICFFVMQVPMGDKEYERFIEYQANAQCARSHALSDQYEIYTTQAEEMLKKWAQQMRGGDVKIFLTGDYTTIAGSHLTSNINLLIAPTIFKDGPESLEAIRKKSSTTYWKKASVKATVDAVLSYNTKQDILEKCSGPARHVEYLLQDSVDDNLNWKDTVDPNHPLKKVCDYVDDMLSGRHTPKNQPFNLGDKLIGLIEPPFGLFQSYAPMAMVAFAMRKYRNVIYSTDGKERTAQHLVEDVVEMFKAWENGKSSNKLNFMFESKDAGRVSKMLIKMFSLNKLQGYSDISSLKDARWAVLHEYSKTKGYPLWSLKYCGESTEQLQALVDNVMKIAIDPESMKNPSLLTSALDEYDQLKTDFQNLLLPSADNFRKGFLTFVKGVEIVNLKDEEFDDAFDYLKRHLEGEVGLWTEDGVKDCMKDWRMTANASEPPVTPPVYPPVTPPSPGNWPPSDRDELKRKRTEARMRVQACGDLKHAVNNLIDSEGDSVIDILLKYV